MRAFVQAQAFPLGLKSVEAMNSPTWAKTTTAPNRDNFISNRNERPPIFFIEPVIKLLGRLRQEMDLMCYFQSTPIKL